MTASDFDKAEVGKRLRMVYPEIGESVDTFITEIKRDYEDAERSSLVVANKETSIAWPIWRTARGSSRHTPREQPKFIAKPSRRIVTAPPGR